jgi:sulfate/thiosulfate transport system substrate-binding protein
MKPARTATNDSLDRIRRRVGLGVLAIISVTLSVMFLTARFRGPDELLNVSYDASREFFREVDNAYVHRHPGIAVRSSHAGSVEQAQGIIKGLKADVLTLATAAEMDAVSEQTGLVVSNWSARFPHGSSPFTSTIVFLVRTGNPKAVNDWDDLVRPDVLVVAPSPKVSGAGRLAYLAAWAYSLKQSPDEKHAELFVTKLYSKNPVLNEGSRGALTAFRRQAQGDVLLTWESEARRAVGENGVEIVYPSISIRAEPVVAIVNRFAEERGTSENASAYLRFLFTQEGQEIAARHYLRPRDQAIAVQYSEKFPRIETFAVEEVFGSWKQVEKKHFESGGIFDTIYKVEELKRHGD